MYQAIESINDNQILETVHTILKSTIVENETISSLTNAQKKEIDLRLAKHKAGKLKYYTLDEVKKAVAKSLMKKPHDY